jgi:hypothetical protein
MLISSNTPFTESRPRVLGDCQDVFYIMMSTILKFYIAKLDNMKFDTVTLDNLNFTL